MEVNNHDENQKSEYENDENQKYKTLKQPKESALESDDDDYFVDDELNFHVAGNGKNRTVKSNNFIPYIAIQTSKGEMKPTPERT